MDQHKTDRRIIDTAERRSYVLALRKAGATYRQIAEAVIREFGEEKLPKGFNELYAYKDVKRELDKLRTQMAEDVGEIRRLEVERLDDLLRGLWKQARTGNQGAVDRVLRIMKRRADLLGLDAPSRAEVTGKDGGPIETKNATTIIVREYVEDNGKND